MPLILWAMPRYTPSQHAALADEVRREGHCLLPALLPPAVIDRWADAFAPLLQRHIAEQGHLQNRGSGRYYVTLPFAAPFADPRVFEDDDILAVVEHLVGADAVFCQLATDTPLLGSEHQAVHRDAPPLFPETGEETPPFQLAVNFPLCDITVDNGPLEVARGTHRLPKAEALLRLEAGQSRLEPVLMKRGDVIVRDVRTLHRGTPNVTSEPRPMVVLGYSRRWLHRPEVSIRVPRAALRDLCPRARELLRFNPIVDSFEEAVAGTEVYQSFAY
ncbi:MAG TPA: phytanoyl-CoA dioxygenase family protein [Kofleriaceae bacterium]|nr:phytanoyl-CoA dioxygenase family protein [Kofleriaceae bacterium]